MTAPQPGFVSSDIATTRSPARSSLATRVTNATTRLIAIAVLTGGLLTASFNLWEPGRVSGNVSPLIEPDAVAPFDAAGLPVTRRTIQGDEAAARNSVVAMCRNVLTTNMDPPRGAGVSKRGPEAVNTDGWNKLDQDPAGQWSIHELSDVSRRIVGVSRGAGESLPCCWGGYDQTAPEEWAIWTMRLPQPEQ